MSTNTLTAISNSLPSDVPKLTSDSVNWGIFKICFATAIKFKEKWSHFLGDAIKPSISKPTATADKTLAFIEWKKSESTVYNLLLQCIHSSAVMKLYCHSTVANAWAALTKEYIQKGTFAQTQLRTNFLILKCPDKGDAHVFLDSICIKKEEPASVGVVINDKDYCSTIIGSLPPFLTPYANSLLTAAKLFSPPAASGSSATFNEMDPDTLITIIADEYDCQHVQCEHHAAVKAGGKPEKNEAIAITPDKDKNSKKHGPTCWECQEVEHVRRNYTKKKTKKEKETASDKPKAGGLANAVTATSDSEDNCVFSVEEVSDNNSLHSLKNVSNSDESIGVCNESTVTIDADWFF